MSQRKKKTRRISPSDEELANEISIELKSCEATSAASTKGYYAIYNLLRKNKPDWMLSPMTVARILDDMASKDIITKISKDDRRYFISEQKGRH